MLSVKNQRINQQKQELEKQKMALEHFKIDLQKENILAQYRTLRNKVNPQFLFKCLKEISSFIVSNPRMAITFTTEFSKMYRYILELKEKIVISVDEEMKLIQSYLALEKMRNGENLKTFIRVETKHFKNFVPPFSVQLLIENAIKHNVVTAEFPLSISIYTDKEYLIVKNNLQRRVIAEKKFGEGISMKSLKDRYEILSDNLPEFWETEREYIVKIPLIKEEI